MKQVCQKKHISDLVVLYVRKNMNMKRRLKTIFLGPNVLEQLYKNGCTSLSKLNGEMVVVLNCLEVKVERKIVNLNMYSQDINR